MGTTAAAVSPFNNRGERLRRQRMPRMYFHELGVRDPSIPDPADETKFYEPPPGEDLGRRAATASAAETLGRMPRPPANTAPQRSAQDTELGRGRRALELLYADLGRAPRVPQRRPDLGPGAYEEGGRTYKPSRSENIMGLVATGLAGFGGGGGAAAAAHSRYFDRPGREAMWRSEQIERLGRQRRRDLLDVDKAEREWSDLGSTRAYRQRQGEQADSMIELNRARARAATTPRPSSRTPVEFGERTASGEVVTHRGSFDPSSGEYFSGGRVIGGVVPVPKPAAPARHKTPLEELIDLETLPAMTSEQRRRADSLRRNIRRPMSSGGRGGAKKPASPEEIEQRVMRSRYSEAAKVWAAQSEQLSQARASGDPVAVRRWEQNLQEAARRVEAARIQLEESRKKKARPAAKVEGRVTAKAMSDVPAPAAGQFVWPLTRTARRSDVFEYARRYGLKYDDAVTKFTELGVLVDDRDPKNPTSWTIPPPVRETGGDAEKGLRLSPPFASPIPEPGRTAYRADVAKYARLNGISYGAARRQYVEKGYLVDDRAGDTKGR